MLRIAFSAFYGVVCLLLIALWVRSYYYRDHYQRRFSATHRLVTEADLGRIYISWRVGDNPRMYEGLSTPHELNSNLIAMLLSSTFAV